VVNVLATGPKERVLKPGRADGFLRVINIRSAPCFQWLVKPKVPSFKILRHVKDPCLV
jgi:hypothetical protein